MLGTHDNCLLRVVVSSCGGLDAAPCVVVVQVHFWDIYSDGEVGDLVVEEQQDPNEDSHKLFQH